MQDAVSFAIELENRYKGGFNMLLLLFNRIFSTLLLHGKHDLQYAIYRCTVVAVLFRCGCCYRCCCCCSCCFAEVVAVAIVAVVVLVEVDVGVVDDHVLVIVLLCAIVSVVDAVVLTVMLVPSRTYN